MLFVVNEWLPFTNQEILNNFPEEGHGFYLDMSVDQLSRDSASVQAMSTQSRLSFLSRFSVG